MRNMYLTNKHPAACRLCGDTVPAGKGTLFAEKGNAITFERDKNPIWAVQHRKIKHCKQPSRESETA